MENRDDTDRERGEQRRLPALKPAPELVHRLETLRQATHRVAHDLNNLLGIILNYSELLVASVADPKLAADIEEIRAAADHAGALSGRLFALARRDVGNPEPLDINEAVTEFVPFVEPLLGEHIQLRVSLSPDPVVVLIRRHQLELILLNLTLNSLEAMSSGGVLSFATRVREQVMSGFDPVVYVDLDVSDTGAGINKDVLARAFEPFFTTKLLDEGTGLGLATVRGIARELGGEVSIESTPGRGTSVSVRLPRLASDS